MHRSKLTTPDALERWLRLATRAIVRVRTCFDVRTAVSAKSDASRIRGKHACRDIGQQCCIVAGAALTPTLLLSRVAIIRSTDAARVPPWQSERAARETSQPKAGVRRDGVDAARTLVSCTRSGGVVLVTIVAPLRSMRQSASCASKRSQPFWFAAERSASFRTFAFP